MKFDQHSLNSGISLRAAVTLWCIGFVVHLALLATLLLNLKTDYAISNMEPRDIVWFLFHSAIVLCFFLSMFAIARCQHQRGTGYRVGLAAGSLALFGATYFAVLLWCVSIAFGA